MFAKRDVLRRLGAVLALLALAILLLVTSWGLPGGAWLARLVDH